VPAPIVVEVYAPQPRPQELAVLISACSRAAAPNECITSEMRSTDSPLGVAIVRRDGDRARIELGLRGSVSADWSTRDLVFQPGDDELERYRAIGFAIGTLVARQVEPPAPPAATTEPREPSDAAEPRPTPATEAPSPRAAASPPPPRGTWLDLSGGVGLGLIPGPPRAGGKLRAATEIIPRGLFGAAETGYAERTGDPSLKVRWLSLGLGVGHPLTPPSLRTLGIQARLLVVLERLSLTALDGERSDGAARWKPGFALAVDAHWQLVSALGLVVSAESSVDPERTVVRTRGTQVAETPALGFNGFVGFRLRLR
jgi:hypothetical protein